jgi:transmembrane sensor
LILFLLNYPLFISDVSVRYSHIGINCLAGHNHRLMNTRLSYLFSRYVDETITHQERQELMELMLQPQYRDEINGLLDESLQQKDERQLLDDGRVSSILMQIRERMHEHDARQHHMASITPVGMHPLRWLRYAAVAAILAVVAAGSWLLLRTSQETFLVADSIENRYKNDVPPGGNRAVLTLHSGELLVLEDQQPGVMSLQGSSELLKIEEGIIAYQPGDQYESETIYNTLSTSRGGKYSIMLSDGSRVWLNAASSITYPVAFERHERRVKITGEVYFEVNSQLVVAGESISARPFIVEVNGMEVEVLGTQFCITAYAEDNVFMTTLVEGSVRLTRGAETVLLSPREQVRIDKKEGSYTDFQLHRNVNLGQALAWKNDLFYFDKTSIESIMNQLARWYNVEVKHEEDIPRDRLSGIIGRDNELSKVLLVLEMSGIKFMIEDRVITVMN